MYEWTTTFTPLCRGGQPEYIRSGGRATFNEAVQAAKSAALPVNEWEQGTWEIRVTRVEEAHR